MATLQVTLDTNAIISTWKKDPQTDACRRIESLARQNRLHLGVASNVDFDDDRGWVVGWVIRGKLEGWLTEVPAIRRREYLNEAAPPPIDADPALEQAVMRCLYPVDKRPWQRLRRSKQMDVDHLLSHRMNERDVFVTGDKGILRKAECLKVLRITVMAPGDFVTTFR